MNSSPMSEGKGEWFLKSETIAFTEHSKQEVIDAFNIIIKGISNRNLELAKYYNNIIIQLKTLSAQRAQEFLIDFLNPDRINDIAVVKSFIYLKKLSEDYLEENKLLEKKLAEMVVIDLVRLLFYKVIPCVNGNHCKHYPRKIVHKNDFLDVELDCYFYHHEKDRRRFVLSSSEKEFCYAGNFSDGKKVPNEKAGYSLNFFESLFHPLYYKNFKCVRTKCQKSVFCPYLHNEDERTVWGSYFKDHFGKDRDVFTRKRNPEEESYQKLKFKKQLGMRNRILMGGAMMDK